MQINHKKLERQQIGVERYFNSSLYGALINERGVIHYATGVGKTYTAILIIKRLFRVNSIHSIVVLVPSEELVNQWRKELSKNFTKKQLNAINIFTPHFVVNNKLKIRTDTLIVDELHEFLGEEFIKTINGTYIQYTNNLGLTATYEDSRKRHLALNLLFPIIDEITEQEAIKEGYVSPFIEFNLSVELTEKEKGLYKEYTTVISETINKFGGKLDLATNCIGGGVHNGKRYDAAHFVFGWAKYKGWHEKLNLNDPRDAQINNIWNPHKVFGYAIKLMNAIRFRKNLLYNCESKISTSLAITFKFYELKTIVFSQSTSFADKLNLFLNEREYDSSVVYHSSLETILLPSPKTGKLIKFGKTRLKKQAIERITTGKSRIICTASSLDKGFNVPDITLGITASGTSNFTQYKQRSGRTKRKNILNDNKVALLVNLYVKDTKDENWLSKRQSKATHKIHWIESVDEISFNPKDKEEFSTNDI